MEIENALIRLREATAEINRATDDVRIKSVLEKTWVLQDRLVFANHHLDAVSKNRIRSFGHVQLCGALHVCWQTKEGVSGQYMVALLYREWLCLATASRFDQIYTIEACIALNNVKVEDVDNGRGLQCHTAPYSWKIVFICDHELYEMILTACTPKEELEWRTRLSSNQQPTESPEQAQQTQPALFSSLSLNIKTLGTVFRKPGTIARRISIHRATTVGPKSPLCQVILKNTSVIKDVPSSSSVGTRGSQINRSQSLLTTNSRIPVLAPSRGDRARLEALLSDVWTRDILPFPGITARSRSEHLVRASASSVMRKLSVVSIASSFAKRSGRSGISPVEDDAGSFSTSPRSRDTMATSAFTVPSARSPASNCMDHTEDASCRSSLLSVIHDEAERERGTSASSLGAAVVNRSATTCSWEKGNGGGGTEEVVLGIVRRLDRVWVRSTSNTVNGATSPSVLLRRSSANTTTSHGTNKSGSSTPSTITTGDLHRVPMHQSYNSASASNLSDLGTTKEEDEHQEVRVENIEVTVLPGATPGTKKGIADKENVCSGAASPSHSQSQHRSPASQSHPKVSRGWTSRRGAGGHREAVVQSIKNIFR